ncbi:MAG: peptidoglycan-binding protein [Paracoccaceae bacterium]
MNSDLVEFHMRLSGVFLCFLAFPAWAEDRALLIGNENYAEASSIDGAADVGDAAPALTVAGFRVLSGLDQTTDDLRGLLSGLNAERLEDGRLVILLAGHFAQGSGQTWFLGTEADAPDLATIAAEGVSLTDVLAIAARTPGGGVVLLGTEDRRQSLGAGLSPGIGPVSTPQGVTVIQGDATDIVAFAAGPLLEAGQSLPAMLEGSDLQAQGFLAPLIAFRPGPGTGTLVPRPVGPDGDDTLWQATELIRTVEAYEAYLARYPAGRHAQAAKAAIVQILGEPQRDARLGEEALGLSTAAKRAVQEALSIIGFDPKGIDGVFGAGSRTAITDWQRRFGHATTGYLTREQIVQLSGQADRRRAQIAEQEAQRAAEREAQDRAYWDQTGKAGDEAGLRAYLARYPRGVFASLARERVAIIEAQKAAELTAADRDAWESAREENTLQSYEAYLRKYPTGAFAELARGRIEAMIDVPSEDPARTRARAEEVALQLSPAARTLIEGRLSSLGLRPGRVDGRFDADARAAIRAFQTSRRMQATGFLNEQTMLALMAGGILQLP